MSIGQNIKRIRKQKKMTQKQLGELCNPSISESTIRKYELGLLNPKIQTIEKISKALGTSVFDLFDIDSSLESAYNAYKESDCESAEAFRTIAQKKYNEFPSILRLEVVFDELNEEGQEEAIKIVESLYHNPKYKKNS